MRDERNFLIHPSYILMYLILGSVTMLFVAFSGAYIYTRFHHNAPPIKLPTLFYVNMLWLIASSIMLQRTKSYYLEDNTVSYKRGLVITLLCTLVFLVLQIMAWRQLLSQDIFLNYSNMSAFMYLITGIHFLHVVIGIPFLMMFILEAWRYMQSPMTVLIYFSDDHKKRKLHIFSIYWHFLDGLWVYLVLFFGVNYLIG